MTSEELREKIAVKLAEGKTFQEIYDELNAAYPGREVDIADLVSELPSLPQRERFDFARKGLIGVQGVLILVLLVQSVLAADNLGSGTFLLWLVPAVVYMVLMAGILRWKPLYFKAAGYLGYLAAGIISRMYFQEPGMSPWVWLDAALFAGVGFLGAIPGHQLVGKYKMAAKQYTDAKGQIRTRYTIRFTN